MSLSPIPATERPYEDVDISSIAFWRQSPEIRDHSFAKLRAKGGVTWHPPVEAQPVPATSPGFWGVSSHAALVEASRDPERFSSTLTSISVYEVPYEMVTATASFMPMDPPQHTRYRRLVSKAFTPRQLQRTDEHIAARAALAVDALLRTGPCNFVDVVANYVPSQVIADMIGVEDQDMREEFVDIVTRLLAFGDPGVQRDDGTNAIEFFAKMVFDLHASGYRHLEERRRNPGDDLMTALMEAEIDGERLTDAEIVSFYCSLVVAGTDTTRNTLTFALQALTDFPEQRQLLLDDLPGRIGAATVEMARWASPVLSFARRATRDTELNGARIAAGDRVVLWYESANRDETVFENPWQFDIRRNNSHQVAWGGGGPHYCLGANLAKVEIRATMTELLTRIPTIRAVGERSRESSPMVNTIEHQPCEWD